MDNEKLFTVKELAATRRLRISRTTIWREIKRGRMRHYRIGGQVFIGEHHIEQYLSQCEERASEILRDIDTDMIAKNTVFAYAINAM
jgi:excisionase family DNA binding protein